MNTSSPTAPHRIARGRPRTFDEPEFLDGAITLFRSRSFSGVSISDLTEATGLTTGSLYKAYKDKRGVFEKALERYIRQREARLAERLDRVAEGRAKLAELLRDYVELSEGRDGRLGCMVVAAVTDLDQLGGLGDTLRQQMAQRCTKIAELVRTGQRDGSITASVDAAVVAEVMVALLNGMRLVGKASTLTTNREAFIACALRLLD